MARQYHKNPRQITRDQMAKLEATLAELGDLAGIVHDLNSDEIIGGNQRSRVFDINDCDVELVQVNDEPDAQGTVAHGFVLWEGNKYAYRQVKWTERQAEKANIVANKAGGNWDFDVLANEFEIDDLLDWGFEAFELGLDEDEPPSAGEDTEPQVDRADELRQKWGVELGQLWRLPSAHGDNEHRLICGDCTDADVVARVVCGDDVGLMLTDPPYGIGLDYDSDFDDSVGAVKELIDGFTAIALSLCDRSLITSGHTMMWDYPRPEWWLCWAEPAGVGRSSWGFTCAQPVLAYGKDPYLANGMGSRPDTFFGKGEGASHDLHPVAKPIAAWEWFLNRGSVKLGEVVYEPFAGSGTTIIAAENLQRQCRAIELSPAYCAVILERYHEHTGLTPELIDRGESEN